MIHFMDWVNAILSHPGTLKIVIFIGIVILFRIYSSDSGAFGMNQVESKNLFSFLLFYFSFIYMIHAERNRPETQESHVFSEFLYVIVITGLFSVLHLDKVFPLMTNLIESITKMILARKGVAGKDEVIKAPDIKQSIETQNKPEEPR